MKAGGAVSSFSVTIVSAFFPACAHSPQGAESGKEFFGEEIREGCTNDLTCKTGKYKEKAICCINAALLI